MDSKSDQKMLGESKKPKTPPLTMADADWDDFWSHKVAEKAKTKVLSYFAVATLSISLLVTIYGVAGIKNLLEERLTKLVDAKSEEAIKRIDEKVRAFDLELSTRRTEVKEKTDLYLSQLAPAPEEFQKTARKAQFKVDLSPQILPILDQGHRAATVGCSIVYAVRCEMPQNARSREVLSWWGLYKSVSPEDRGASMVDALDYASSKGIYSNIDWPIDDSSPRSGAAPVVIIEGWSRINLDNLNDIEPILKEGHAVLVGVLITEDFYETGPDGRVTIAADKQQVGGHVLTIVGYSEGTDEYRFANSWGTNWGDDGFGIIKADGLQRIARGAYVLTSVKTN